MNKKLLLFSVIITLCWWVQNTTFASDPYIRIRKGENLFFDQLNLRVDSSEMHLEVKITNLIGQTVQEFKVLRSLSFVPTSTLKPGYYILRISSGAYITTQRVVVTA